MDHIYCEINMTRFCKHCSNKLQFDERGQQLVAYCEYCNSVYILTGADTRVYTLREKTMVDMYGELISSTPYDPVSKLIDQECALCKRDIMYCISLGGDQKPLVFCKCQITKETI